MRMDVRMYVWYVSVHFCVYLFLSVSLPRVDDEMCSCVIVFSFYLYIFMFSVWHRAWTEPNEGEGAWTDAVQSCG